jgi:prepilin-type processing-associated H-X9-DG protein
MQNDTATTPTPRERKRMPRAVSRLIVWVVVLGVLAGMLIPAQMRARESARRAACLSNLKQLGLGLKQYAEDFDDVYPWRVGASNPAHAWRDLGLLFPEYLPEAKAFSCPSAPGRRLRLKRDRNGAWPLEPVTADGRQGVTSYSYGVDARGGALHGKTYSHLPWTERARSTVRVMADKKAGREMTDLSAHQYKGEPHGRNVLYQDGHVKWKSGKKALDPEPDDDEIGAPDAKDYTAWWSDPPYYGE